MRALVWEGPRRLAVREKPVPRPRPGEVLIRTKAVGLCGSDVHIYEGEFAPAVPPLTLGHESTGWIEESTEGCPFPVGQRVAVNPNVGCGGCHFCLRGLAHHCVRRRIIGMAGWDGGLADYLVAPFGNVFPLPESVSWTDAASIDPLASALHGLNIAGLNSGESAAVFGAGPSGLGFIQLCRIRGAQEIIAIDPDDRRLAEAKRYGATHAVNPAHGDCVEAIRNLTAGLGVDLAIEASGATAAVLAALRSTRNCGRMLNYGTHCHAMDGVDFQDQRRREITIYGSTGAPDSYAESIALAASGKVRVGSMVTHAIGLEDAPQFFADNVIRDGKDGCLKAIVFVANI